MSSATGNRYLVGRMGVVRVLVNNRREGHADASSFGGLLPVRTTKLPHLRHVALEPAHVTQQGTEK
jgi:hypothetical protein